MVKLSVHCLWLGVARGAMAAASTLTVMLALSLAHPEAAFAAKEKTKVKTPAGKTEKKSAQRKSSDRAPTKEKVSKQAKKGADKATDKMAAQGSSKRAKKQSERDQASDNDKRGAQSRSKDRAQTRSSSRQALASSDREDDNKSSRKKSSEKKSSEKSQRWARLEERQESSAQRKAKRENSAEKTNKTDEHSSAKLVKKERSEQSRTPSDLAHPSRNETTDSETTPVTRWTEHPTPSRAADKSTQRVTATERASQSVQDRAAANTIIQRDPPAASLSPAPMATPRRVSMGRLYGLHETIDPLDLKSGVALVIDQDTNEVLLDKNAGAVLPIASLTKLMTALVTVEAKLSMEESVEITADDIDFEKGSRSRLATGSVLTRGDLLHIALMASENRAANALGRSYPGGLYAFIAAMNRKAYDLGMRDTRYVEPTGLSSQNQSSAKDLALLVRAAYRHPIIRQLSTSPEYEVWTGERTLRYRSTNALILDPSWEIGLQKTGYISEAGRCLMMQARVAGRRVIMVFLDSNGKYSRIGDARRVKDWLEGGIDVWATRQQPTS